MKGTRSLIFLAALLFSLTANPPPGWAEVRIAVFPFTYEGTGPKNPWLPAALADILSSRLYVPKQVSLVDQARIKTALQKKKGALTQEAMKVVGSEAGAQSFVAGIIDEQGETITVTAHLIPVEPFAPSGTFSVTCNGRNELIGKVSTLAMDMKHTLVGPAAKEALFARQEPAGETQGLIQEEELASKAQAGSGLEGEGISETEEDTSPAPIPPPLKTWPCSWQSEAIPERVRGIAVGDVDGDGGNELALLAEQEVLVVRKTENGLETRGKYKEPGQCHFLRVESGDINGNGVSELFVTSVREKPPLGAVAEYQKEQGEELASLVIEWNEKALKKIGENLPWFLSLLPSGTEGMALWGQEAGKDAPLAGAILPLAWNGESYVPSGEPGLPAGLQVLGMGILTREGRREYLQLDSQGGLSIHGPEGEVMWGGDEVFGGSDLRVTMVGSRAEWKTEAFTLPLRVLVRDLNDDQEDDILVGKNQVRKTRVLISALTVEKGEISSLVWKGDHMEVCGRTADREEGVADYCVADGDNDGKEELIVVVRPPESFFSLHPKSYVAFYELN